MMRVKKTLMRIFFYLLKNGVRTTHSTVGFDEENHGGMCRSGMLVHGCMQQILLPDATDSNKQAAMTVRI